jgi:hypothetical protein
MQNIALSRYTSSFGLSLGAASVVNALLVVAKEKSHVVMIGLQKLTGHHWITHSAIVLIVFTVLGLTFAHADGGRGVKITADRLVRVLIGSIVLGSLVIVGFYLIAD